jgi:hypothetical protein
LKKLLLGEIAAHVMLPDFIYAVAVFVCYYRQKVAGYSITSYDEDRLEIDSSWVGYMRAYIHPSVRCWRASGSCYNDPEYCEEDIVRCTPDWYGNGLWREDYVWVQEFEYRDGKRLLRTVINGMVVA